MTDTELTIVLMRVHTTTLKHMQTLLFSITQWRLAAGRATKTSVLIVLVPRYAGLYTLSRSIV